MPPTGPPRDRGSRKHILDLVSSPDFAPTLDVLLAGTGFRVGKDRHCRPVGRSCAADWNEYRVEDYLQRHPVSSQGPILDRKWWISHAGNRPNWDLICRITDGTSDGLLLVEAKAHEGEMSEQNRKSQPDPSNPNSVANARQIRHVLQQTNSAMGRLGFGAFGLSADHHYQLSNRIAYAYKLATLGLPVILMYLGFVGDRYFPTDWIRSPDHWQRLIEGYLQGVVPLGLPERTVSTGSGSLVMVVRSLDLDSGGRP